MTDEQLEALYKSAFNESHIAGLRAVWLAAQPALQETIDTVAINETEPMPVVEAAKKLFTKIFTKKAKK